MIDFPVWHPGPLPFSDYPTPPTVSRGLADRTLGGAIYELDTDGSLDLSRPTGHKMRGNSEAMVIASLNHRGNLKLYYGAWGECVGMGV